MSKFRFAIGVLAASSGLGAAVDASATTLTFDYSGLATPQNVDILGTTEYTYGAIDDSTFGTKSVLSPVGDAQTGSYTANGTPSAANDSYTGNQVKTSSVFTGGPAYSGDSYANLKFDVDGVNYIGTAEFETQGDDVVLHSISFEAAAVPEPEAWALLIAGMGFAGAALRHRRRQSAAIA